MSSLNIIHRDLACRNVLVDDNNVLKISDFGLARKSEAYVSRMKDRLPLRWMAPETCNEGLFTEHSDVYVTSLIQCTVCIVLNIHRQANLMTPGNDAQMESSLFMQCITNIIVIQFCLLGKMLSFQ